MDQLKLDIALASYNRASRSVTRDWENIKYSPYMADESTLTPLFEAYKASLDAEAEALANLNSIRATKTIKKL